MKAGLLFTTTLAIATTSLAAPALTRLQARSLLSGNRQQHGRRQIPAECDLAGLDDVVLPVANPALPSPGEDLWLAAVVIGRGVQNYTCAGLDATAAPVATGAIATLYYASCIAVQDPALLAALPGQAFDLPLPSDPLDDLMCGSQPIERAGFHFFNAAKTPTFDFRESGDEDLGLGLVAVNSRSPAPDAAKDVPWLFLTRVDGSEGPIQSIYRLNTVGGVAPATCAGQPSDISVPYSAQYWAFSSDP